MQALLDKPKARGRKAASVKVSLHPAEQYVRDVIAGTVVAGRAVRLACERHLKDLDRGHERGLWFDREQASIAIELFGLLRHSKGEWRGQIVHLEPWEQFILWSVFGWMRKNERGQTIRRFRVAYAEVARGNGKTTLMAGVGIKLLKFDNEGAAEVFCAATKREQASFVHGEAVRMIKASPELLRLFKITKSCVYDEETGSVFMPLSSDKEGEHGRNTHGGIVDEVHVHKDRDCIDIIETSMGKRRQPLLVMITTAGKSPSGVAWDFRKFGSDILEGLITGPSADEFFCFIASLDDEDDWKDPNVWIKANPNLGVSVKMEDLRAKCDRAQHTLSYQNSFRQLHLNQWIGSSKADISMDAWKRCGGKFDIEKLRERPCCAGLDMAAQFDLNAFSLCWPGTREDPLWYYLWWFWAPEARERKRERLVRMTYEGWAKAGFIKITEGDVADYNVIQDDIEKICAEFKVQEIGFDPYNATNLEQNLTAKGHKMVLLRQGFGTLHAPTKMFDSNIVAGKIKHGDNPVAAWMASNVVYRRDTINGSMMPHKEKSAGKIDGIAAAIMATNRAMVMPEPIDLEGYGVHWV